RLVADALVNRRDAGEQRVIDRRGHGFDGREGDHENGHERGGRRRGHAPPQDRHAVSGNHRNGDDAQIAEPGGRADRLQQRHVAPYIATSSSERLKPRSRNAPQYGNRNGVSTSPVNAAATPSCRATSTHRRPRHSSGRASVAATIATRVNTKR